MKVADVLVFWTPSVSTDVAQQQVALKLASGEVVSEVVLDPSVDRVQFDGLQQSTDYVVVHTVTDGVNSAVATLQFNLGDLEAPMPVTGLGYSVVSVRDVE